MIIEDTTRGMEFHLDLTKDNKIKKVEIIFAEPKELSCLIRPEMLFTICNRHVMPQQSPIRSR